MQNYYKVLGLTQSATDTEIKAAYRKKALTLHPDRGGTTEGFQKLQEAYDTLSNAENRKNYDLKQRYSSTKRDSNPFDDAFDEEYGEYNYEWNSSKYSESWEDLLKEAFARKRREQEEQSYYRKQSYEMANKDVMINAKITMKQSFTGATLSAKFKLPNGKIKQVLVDIPAGVSDQQTIIIKGAGDNSSPWKPAGDLKVLVTVTDVPGVKRIGDDVYINKRISIVTAMVGSKNFVVDTLDGTPMSIVIQPGTNSGTISRHSGKGFPNVKTGERGTLYVVVYVDIPAVKNIEPATLAQLEEIYAKISKVS